MAWESTFVMLKPDALKRGIAGEIIARIERRGYRIKTAKTFMLNEALLKEHYAHLAEESFFPEIVAYMVSGPVMGLVVEGDNAVSGVRGLMGATKFEQMQPGSIRGDFASSTRYNVIHGADSVENAAIEIKRFNMMDL